jgi:flagellar hook-associated protein 1 FlgK
MGLNGSLLIGQSALLASQAAMQVAGNNLANAATPGYHRQIVALEPAPSDRVGTRSFVGTGVLLRDISRVVDTALQTRVRSAISRESGAGIDQRYLATIESLQNELTDQDLSSRLSEFFNAFSELANNPNDVAVRSVVLQQAGGVADHLRTLRSEYVRVRDEVDRGLSTAVKQADGILDQIAEINAQITQSEQGQAKANGLRDRRDALVDELSALLDVTTIEQPNGALDVLVGSLPIVLAGQSRGVELRVRNEGSERVVDVRIREDGSTLGVEEGTIGAMLRQRSETVDPAIDTIDRFANAFAYEVNRLHSQGQGLKGWGSVTGAVQVTSSADPLGSPAAGVPFAIQNGSFRLHVTDAASGLRQTAQILVDPATTSLNDLVAAINAAGLPNMTASATPDGRLKLDGAPGNTLTFSDDTSGVLAALGVNVLFTGKDAGDIRLNQALLDDPALLASGKDHVPGSNGAALSIVALEDSPLGALGGLSLRGFWQSEVNAQAVRTRAAGDAAAGAGLVRQSLDAQAQAVSGVSVDEEAIDLLSFQRQYQAAARYLATIDEAMQTLLSIA